MLLRSSRKWWLISEYVGKMMGGAGPHSLTRPTSAAALECVPSHYRLEELSISIHHCWQKRYSFPFIYSIQIPRVLLVVSPG